MNLVLKIEIKKIYFCNCSLTYFCLALVLLLHLGKKLFNLSHFGPHIIRDIFISNLVDKELKYTEKYAISQQMLVSLDTLEEFYTHKSEGYWGEISKRLEADQHNDDGVRNEEDRERERGRERGRGVQIGEKSVEGGRGRVQIGEGGRGNGQSSKRVEIGPFGPFCFI